MKWAVYRYPPGSSHWSPSLDLCVCESLNDHKGEWIVPLKSRIDGTADMGFLFRLDQCDHNVTGMCPLQSIPVTISHIRVGSVCVSG